MDNLKTSKTLSNLIKWRKINKSLFFLYIWCLFWSGYLTPIGTCCHHLYFLWSEVSKLTSVRNKLDQSLKYLILEAKVVFWICYFCKNRSKYHIDSIQFHFVRTISIREPYRHGGFLVGSQPFDLWAHLAAQLRCKNII